MAYSLVVEPTVSRDKKRVLDNLAAYTPTEKEADRIKEIKGEFAKAEEIRNRPFREFNYRDVSQYSDDMQDRFINFIEDLTEGDPDQEWKANTMRPLTRNKVIEIAAYVTTRVMYPRVIAQNDSSEIDKTSATVMEDLMRWTNDQSNYDLNFMYNVISMLVFPVGFIYEGYAEYKRDFKEIQADGSWKFKEEVDDIFSGYQSQVIPYDEIYIGNAYEHDIQKQPFLIWRRIIDYPSAKIKYGDNENFNEYVKPGIRFFMGQDESIYEQEDESIGDDGVEEVIYYNRLADLELRFCNGVLLDNPDRPMQRKDKRYPFAKGGYGLFDSGKFFYHKSLVDDLKPDQDQADTLINLILDGTFLKMMPPSVLYGDEMIDTGIMVPGTVHPMAADAKLEPVQIAGDVGLGVNVLQNIEQNAANSSQKDIVQPRQQTAYEISRIEEDIKTKLGLFGKMIADVVQQFGQLRINTILQHMTMPQVGQITDSGNAIKYTDILIEDEVEGTSKRIQFAPEIPEEGMTDEEELSMSYEILAEEGGKLENGKEIVKVQPKLFRELKYKVKIQPNAVFKTSEAAERAFALELADRLSMDPLADQNARFKLLIDAYKPGEVDKFKMKQEAMQAPMPGVGPAVPPSPGGAGITQGAEVEPQLPPGI